MRLNLFRETDFVAVLQRFEQSGSGYAWVGRIEGEPLSSVILVTVDRTVSGNVWRLDPEARGDLGHRPEDLRSGPTG